MKVIETSKASDSIVQCELLREEVDPSHYAGLVLVCNDKKVIKLFDDGDVFIQKGLLVDLGFKTVSVNK